MQCFPHADLFWASCPDINLSQLCVGKKNDNLLALILKFPCQVAVLAELIIFQLYHRESFILCVDILYLHFPGLQLATTDLLEGFTAA